MLLLQSTTMGQILPWCNCGILRVPLGVSVGQCCQQQQASSLSFVLLQRLNSLPLRNSKLQRFKLLDQICPSFLDWKPYPKTHKHHYCRLFLLLCYCYSYTVLPLTYVHIKHLNSCWNIQLHLLVQLQFKRKKPKGSRGSASAKLLSFCLILCQQIAPVLKVRLKD